MIDLLAQCALIVIGVVAAFTSRETTTVVMLALWCATGTLYAVVAVIVLSIAAWRKTEVSPASKWHTSLATRGVSLVATILASLVGVTATISVLLSRGTADALVYSIVGVWAMLLAWGFLHWGFAQVYYRSHYAGGNELFRFPNTDHPGMVDFVYFAYTMGTTFAVSDVETRSTRARWMLTCHSVVHGSDAGWRYVHVLVRRNPRRDHQLPGGRAGRVLRVRGADEQDAGSRCREGRRRRGARRPAERG